MTDKAKIEQTVVEEVHISLDSIPRNLDKALLKSIAESLNVKVPASITVMQVEETDRYDNDGDVFYSVTIEGPADKIKAIAAAEAQRKAEDEA